MNHLVQRYLPTLEEKQGIFRVVISFLLKGKQCCQVNTQQEPWLVVMSGDNSCSNGCGFESRRCILDGHLDIFSHCFCCKNCIVCLKRPTINEKEVGLAKFLKPTVQKYIVRNDLASVYLLPNVAQEYLVRSIRFTVSNIPDFGLPKWLA